MMRWFHALAATLLCLSATTLAQAQCTTTISPGADLTATVAAATAGSTICLNIGTYLPPAAGFPNNQTFAIGNGVTVRGLGATPAQVVLAGGAAGSYAIFFTNYLNNGKVASNSTLQNLTINGGQGGVQILNFNNLPAGRLTDITLKDVVISTASAGGSSSGVLANKADRINLDNVTITSQGSGIRFQDVTTSLVMNSTVVSTQIAGASALVVEGGSANVVVRNTFGSPKVGGTYSIPTGGVVFYNTFANRYENNVLQGFQDDGLDFASHDLTGTIATQATANSIDNYAGKNIVIATGFADGRVAGAGIWSNCSSHNTWLFANEASGMPECAICVYNGKSNMLLGNNLHAGGIVGAMVSGGTENAPFCTVAGGAYLVKPVSNFVMSNYAYFNKLEQFIVRNSDTTTLARNFASPRNGVGGALRSDCQTSFCQSAITFDTTGGGTNAGARIVANVNSENIRGFQSDDGQTSGIEFAYNRLFQPNSQSFSRYNLGAIPNTTWDGGVATGGNYWTLFPTPTANPSPASPYGTAGNNVPAQGVYDDLSNNTGAIVDRYPFKTEDLGRGYTTTIFEPRANSSFAQGARRTVRWHSPGCSYQDIYFDGSALLAGNVPNTGYAIVTIPLAATVGGGHTIVMNCKDSAGTLKAQATSAAFSVSSSTLELVAPGRDDVFNASSQVIVAWKKTAAVASVNIHLSTDGGTTFPTTLASAQTGTFARVTLPAINSTANAVIRVVDTAGGTGDWTDGVFAIRGAAGAGFSNVPSGRKFQQGQFERLEWASPQNSRLVDITATVGGVPKVVASNLPDRGNFDWIVPEWATNGTLTLAANFKTNVGAAISSASTTNGSTQFPTMITFNAPGSVGIGATANVTATANSGLAVTLSSLTPTCTISGNTVTGVSAGTCTIAANQAGNATYAPAPQAITSFSVVSSVNPPRLFNISTRMQVLTGNDVLIGGFVISGPAAKTVAIVATGPSLAAFGIANPLANPTLTLVRQSDQVVLATNDDWGVAANASQIQASGFAPSNASEAAILISLAPGAYTAIVSGSGGGTGVGVVAVYEVDHADVPLVNISTRGQVLTGNDVMIGGFVISGNASLPVAIVATGPSLAAFGISNPLANPTISLVRSSDQTVLATNDNWQSDANAGTLQAKGFAPSNPFESGIYTTLPPGAYTVILSGVGGGTGVGIIGVYYAP